MKVIQFPHQGPDVQEMILDGKPEMMLSARGVLLLALAGWKEESLEASKDAVCRYCEYVCLHGFPGGANAAMTALKGMSTDDAEGWLKRTFAQFVTDQNALMGYVLGALA